MCLMTHIDGTPDAGRWQEPKPVTTGDHTFRVVAHLRPDIKLTDRQIAYGLTSVLVGHTVAEVRRLMAWQDGAAYDYERLSEARQAG